MSESQLFPDLPQSTDPANPQDELTNNPGYRHAVFGLAVQLNEAFPEAVQPEQDASAMAEASIALNAATWWLTNFRLHGSESHYLTQDTYEATGLPTTSLCKALRLSTLGAKSLNTLTSLLYHEQTTPDGPTPGIDWLSARQYPPDEARVLMQGLRDEILNNIATVSENLANVLSDIFIRHKAAHLTPELDDKVKKLTSQDESRILVVEELRAAVRQKFDGVPQVDVGDMPASKLLQSIITNYNGMQRIMAELPPSALPDRKNPQDIEQSVLLNIRPEPARQAEYTGDETAQLAATLRDEAVELLRLHKERATVYQDDMGAWIHTQKLQSLLRHQQLLGSHSNNNQTVRRVVNLMLGFSGLGSTSSKPHEIVQLDLERQLAEFFTFERAIGANLKKAAVALKTAGVTAPLPPWEPVESDTVLLSKHWRGLLPVIRESWPDGNGQEVATAITNVLKAFDVYRNEIANPEGRLKAIATHLGATVLRPERHPRAAHLDPVQRRTAIANILEDIASNEQLQENTRYRAEVLKHFMAGELFYFPPTKEQSIPYFCVNFRSPKGTSWVLLESLLYGKASYIFPQALVEKQGKEAPLEELLEDFLNRYSKTKLVQDGGIQAIHTPGWTPDSHIQSIQQKAAAADGVE